jgi:exonuclease III
MDTNTSDRPQRRTAIVARELKRYNIDIAALSETRRAGEGQLTEHGGGYTFFWKGKDEDQPRIHGVGFAIKNHLVEHLDELPSGISERLMTLRLKLENNQRATIISAYAPTLDSDDDKKEEFYNQLDRLLTNTPRSDKLILLGDFNARVGRDSALWTGTIGKEGVGNSNSNGILLLTKCSEHDLIITNTLFRQRDRLKTTWQHPRSKHWHLIDYIIVRAKDRGDVRVTRALTQADDCWTDHRMVRSVMSLQVPPKRRKQGKQVQRRLNIEQLKDEGIKRNFQLLLNENLPGEYPDNVEQHWSILKTAMLSACQETTGFIKRKHQDWFDENDKEIQGVIDQKRKAYNTWQNDPNSVVKKQAYLQAKAEVQRRTRTLKNEWWTTKAVEMENLAASNNTRAFFSATKIVYGPSNNGLNPLRSKDGNQLLKDPASISSRWREHFQELLNRESHVNDDIFNRVPQKPIQDHLSDVPSIQEVEKAIHQLKNNKATGLDGVPAELFKVGGPALTDHTHGLIVKIWNTETIPTDLRDTSIVTIFKKGDKAQCGNYRGISLLSAAGKILARILSNRLLPIAETTLPETQCGFRPNRGTADMIFGARQMQEKSKEQNQPLYMAFIDLVKAFDSVNREALWKILALDGCPPKFINIIRLLHDNMKATVLTNNGPGEAFTISTGVKQGCVIAPSLFSMFLGTVLHLVEENLPRGVEVTYRIDGKLFNLNRLRAKTKVSTTTVMELQYADDNVILANTEEDLQTTLNAFRLAYESIGLELNTDKTKIIYQPAPNTNVPGPAITINEAPLENVKYFPYLGSYLSTDANIDAEIQHRLKCASAAFGRLMRRVFDNHDLSAQTKVSVYNAIIIPTLLYGCETWTTYRRHLKGLEKYHQRCLRRILKVRWQDRRTNNSILQETNSSSIEAMIIKHQLRWTGHVVRMPDSRLPKQIMYSQLRNGQRNQGGQFKRYKDVLKANMKKCQIDTDDWENVAMDRRVWRQSIYQGSQHFEQQRRRQLDDKRNRRREQERLQEAGLQQQRPADGGWVCLHCGRVCGSRIGLFSHQRTHR